MKVSTTYPWDLTEASCAVMVVIDVLRATSTATTLLAHGVQQLEVVATESDLYDVVELPVDTVVFSELKLKQLTCKHVDNSPWEVSRLQLTERPVLMTTNGTKVIARALQSAKRVFLCSLLNISSVADKLLMLGLDVTIIPSGGVGKSEPHLEDDLCAQALATLLAGDKPNYAEIAETCRAAPRIKRRFAEGINFSQDFEICVQPNRYAVVPEVFRRYERGREALIIEPAGTS